MIIDRLDRLEARLQEAGRRRDAEGLALAAMDLDAALRQTGARLETLLEALGPQPGPGHCGGSLSEISRKSLDLLVRQHSLALWQRWEEPLRGLYLELGRRSLAKGRLRTARTLLGQAVAANPTLPLDAEEAALLGPVARLRPRRRHSLAAWFPPGNEISSVVRHPASGDPFVLDHVSGEVLRLDAALVPREKVDAHAAQSWTMFPDPGFPGGGTIWICHPGGERLIGLDTRGREAASLPLSKLLGPAFGTVRPLFGASEGGWLYLVVDVPADPTLLIRFRPEDPAGTVQTFGHPWFKTAFGVHCRGDLLLTVHWQPCALMVLRLTEAGSWTLVRRILLPRPHAHPLSCCLLQGQIVLTTNNSLLRLGDDFHPLYRHDQLAFPTSVLDQAFERFCPDGDDGLLALDRLHCNLWQVTP